MIRWDYVAKAIEYYQQFGYTYVEVPWVVPMKAIEVTLPEGHQPHVTMDGPLVGSAEQSFIHLAQTGQLQLGRHLAATPCFRDDAPDTLHQRSFFKVELIDLYLNNMPQGYLEQALEFMLKKALSFFRSLPGGEAALVIGTSAGFDIELHGIEIGSYGLRQHDSWLWIYGTGFADPRFSIASTQSLV